MGDQEGVATQLAALLQCPAVVTAIGAALAPFLAGTPPAAIDHGAARSRSRSKGRKGGGGPIEPPTPHPPPPSKQWSHCYNAKLRRSRAELTPSAVSWRNSGAN